ncbi:hypothetical protein EMIT0373P_60617 [Pseudomonas chlororaphis]
MNGAPNPRSRRRLSAQPQVETATRLPNSNRLSLNPQPRSFTFRPETLYSGPSWEIGPLSA